MTAPDETRERDARSRGPLSAYEVLIPRKIEPQEIRGVRHVSHVVGWRYWPDAHGTPPCPCDVCQRGSFGGARIRVS